MMSNNYDDDQSEDGELARSPIQDELDFSLSDDDRDHPDALVIKPPQAIVRPSHRERRAHKKSLRERHKDSSRKDKKHLYRDREKTKRELGKSENNEMSKDYYRDKPYHKEKERYRDKEIYRGTKEKDGNREKDLRDKEAYRDKETYRDRDMFKETTREAQYREMARHRDKYKEEFYAEKFKDRDRDLYMSREQVKYIDSDRRPRKEQNRIESRLRQLAEDSHPPQNNEKENRDRTTGDKELEDLRTRLLSKRINKDHQQNRDTKKHPNSTEKETKTERDAPLDKNTEERRKRLLQADREMEQRKYESRTELEARREERRRRGKRRSVTPEETNSKKSKIDIQQEDIVTVSDTSDVEMKSDVSEHEEGEHSRSESEEEDDEEEEEDSTSSESDSDGDTKSAESDDGKGNHNEDEEKDSDSKPSQVRHSSKSPARRSDRDTPSSNASRRSRSRSKSRSRSRSHSFSPPPPGDKPPTEDKNVPETDEEAKRREEKLSALPPYFPALQGCRSVEEFQCLNRIEEGTYGVVYRARDKTTEEIVALKRLKMEKEKEGFPITSLREINTLLKGQHPNIVTVREIVVGSNMDKIFIVMDYVEHDLKSLMETMRGKKQVFLPGEVKCLMTQLLKAVFHLHDNWILHRDLKTSNLLLSHKGVLKVGDFGLAREYGSPLRQYTPVVVTLWYRAPELLLCTKEYSTAIDIWSVGCIFAEFITMHPLFPGKSEVDQLNRIFKDLGTPSESVWSGYSQLPAVQKMTFAEHPAGGLRQRVGADLLSDTGLTLLQGLLTYDPVKRLSADAALEHAYFKENPVAIDPAMFPTWPAKSEGGRRSTQSPRPPAGGAALRDSDEPPAHFRLAVSHPPRSISVAPGFSLKF